jgi:hypothetical protein
MDQPDVIAKTSQPATPKPETIKPATAQPHSPEARHSQIAYIGNRIVGLASASPIMSSGFGVPVLRDTHSAMLNVVHQNV